MKFYLCNVTDKLIDSPIHISDIEARDYDDAFIKSKKILSDGIREQLGLVSGMRIAFTELKQDPSLGYGERVQYTTCSIEDKYGFTIDTYDYAIGIEDKQ